ncbi:Ribonuclease HII [Bienertia sinuspersici]
MGASFNIDDAMIEEAIEPLNVLIDRTIPGKGKYIHIERNLAERSNLASPAQTHHPVHGPSMFENNAKTLGIPLDAKGIPKAPSHGDAVPTPSISTICVTSASQGHLALKASLSDHRRSDLVEEERLAVVEELKLAESSYDIALTKHKGLEEESAALKKKEDELLKELKDVRQQRDQVTNDLGDNRNSLTTLEATMHATQRHMEKLEVVPVCSSEEMELFEEQERKLLEFQSSLDNSEWIVYNKSIAYVLAN